jgi:hypothetical protein
MTAQVIGRNLCLREIVGGAPIDRCRLRRGEMIAPCVGNSKCFDELDDVRIERPQRGRWQGAVVAIFPLFYLFHAAGIMRSV